MLEFKVSRHSGPCHSGHLPSGPGLNVKMNFFFKMTFRPTVGRSGPLNKIIFHVYY